MTSGVGLLSHSLLPSHTKAEAQIAPRAASLATHIAQQSDSPPPPLSQEISIANTRVAERDRLIQALVEKGTPLERAAFIIDSLF